MRLGAARVNEMSRQGTWRISRRTRWVMDRPRLLAIVNVTPDSFSDGGRIATIDDAARHASEAVAAGAAGVDVGAESTRPGAARVEASVQIRRAIPAIEAIRRAVGDEPVITIDTTRAEVARAALDAGADAINDVSGGTEDPDLLEIGRPILSGVSRKSFTARAAGLDMNAPPATRVHASIGLSVLHLHAGARVFRVHDVAEHAAALGAAWAAMSQPGR